MQTAIDHIVVAGATLETATEHMEQALGLRSVDGGRHALMGTHNRLLSLGPDIYAEALARDPEAPAPGRARWFGLDGFSPDPGPDPTPDPGPESEPAPRLAAWALRVDDLDEALAHAPDGTGKPIAMWRGDYRWRITVPDDGMQPFDGLFPALISWEGPAPAAALPDTGSRLISLTLRHPEAGRLGWALSMLCDDDRVTVRAGAPGLSALIHMDDGERVLT